MAISGVRVTVATTETSIADGSADTSGGHGDAAGYNVNVRNRGSVAVYLGGTGVLTTTGYQLDPAEAVGFHVYPAEVLFGIVASGTAVVHVLKGGA